MTTTTTTRDAAQLPRGRQKRGNTDGATLTSDQRAERAYQMRLQGHGWETIALALGYRQRGNAYRAAMRHAVKVDPATPELRVKHRPRALEQLDMTWDALEPSLMSADDERRQWAISCAERLINLYAKWLECKPSETPVAVRLAAYGMQVTP